MKVLCVFFVLMLLSMSFTVFTDTVFSDQDGPYTASATVSIEDNWIIGGAGASGSDDVRNGSYMCSIGMEVSPVSDNDINGDFSDSVSHMRLRTDKTMYANSDSWGSDINGNNWHASDSDSGQ